MVRRAPSHLDSYIDMVPRQLLQCLGALRGLRDLSPRDDWGRHSPHFTGQAHLRPGDVVNTSGRNDDHRSELARAVARLVQVTGVPYFLLFSKVKYLLPRTLLVRFSVPGS